MKSLRKLSACLAIALLTTSLGFAGCSKKSGSQSQSSSNTSASSSSSSAVDTSKHLSLVGYLLGDKPKGMPDVLSALNTKLKKDLNVDLTLNYLGWGEYQTKYPLLLAAGQNVDFIYTGGWCFQAQESQKGAFASLSMDDIQKYMPKQYAAVNALGADNAKELWREGSYNGTIYMIPTMTPDRKVGIMVWRKDLADQWGIDSSKITTLTELQKSGYFDDILSKEPGMIPIYIDNTKDIGSPFNQIVWDNSAHGWSALTGVGTHPVIFQDFEGSDTSAIYKLTDPAIQADYLKAGQIIVDWASKGYINKDALANTTDSTDEFMAGKSGVAFMNSVDLTAQLAAAKKAGYTLAYAPLTDSNGHAGADGFNNNGVAISAFTSKERKIRTMMLLDLLMQDKTYDTLAYFGIEGKNYNLTSDGKVDELDSTYAPDASGFWFLNKNIIPAQASWSPEYIALSDKCKTSICLVRPLNAFLPDVTDATLTSEVGNTDSVVTQYLYPLYLGQKKDVAGALSTLNAQLNKAGIDDIYTQIDAQVKKYING